MTVVVPVVVPLVVPEVPVVVVCDNTEVAIAVKAKVTSILFMSLLPFSQNYSYIFI
jgi:hypothetical protein